MADTISLQAILSVKDKNFSSTIKSAQSTLSNLDSSASKSSSSVGALGTAFAVAQQVVSAACNVIKSSVQAAVERVDTLNQFPQVMQQMGFSSEEAEASINKLSDGIMGLPTSLDSIVSSTQSIALITGDLDEATDVALALNDAFLASGSSSAEAASGTEAYNKMLSTGKVNQQNWITLQQNMGWALSEVSGQLGYATDNTWELYYAMQDGSVTFDDFNTALIECDTAAGGFAETAQVSTAGIATSWQNVETAVVRGVANMIQSWNDAAENNGIPTIQESLNGLRTVVDTVFNACSAAITVFVNNLDIIVAACAPVVAAIAAFEIAKKAGEWFKTLGDKAKDSASILQNYEENAAKAKDTTGELKEAEERAKSAADNYKTAQENLGTAIDNVKTAKDQSKQADEDLAKAEEDLKKKQDDVTSSADEVHDAEEKVKEAKKNSETASENLTEALEKEKEAEQEKSDAANMSAAAEEIYTDKQNEQAAAIEGTTLKAIAHSAIMNVLTGQMNIGQAAVKAFNAAWDANPIGLVTTAITTLISVVSTVITVLEKFGIIDNTAAKQSKEFKQEVEALTDSIEENRDAMEENTTTAQNQSSTVNDLCANIIELADNENKSAEDTSLLRTYIDQLNDSVDGLGLVYDETTDSLNMATEAMLAQAEVENKSNEYAAAQDNYNQALEDYLSINDELVAAEELQAETADAGVIAKQRQKSAVQDLEDAQAEQAEVLENALNEMQAAEAEYTAAQNEACALQEQALAESVANQTLTLDELSEANQETVQQLQSTWQDYTDAATNMFDTLDTEVETTVEDMIENMQKNQEIMAQWGDNCENLRDRFANLGLDPAILDQLVDLGPEGAGYIQELVEASDDKLIELEKTYSQGGETAYTAMCQSLGEGATEVIDEAKNLVIETEDSFRAQVEATDWTSLGTSMDEGVVEGVESGAGEIGDAASTAVTDARTAAGEAAGEGSPAAEWVPLGESMDEGVAEGLLNSTAGVEAAQQMADNILQAADEALSAADFSGAVDSMCSSIASATESGMQQVSTAVTNAMNQATQALNNGFTQMASATTTNMATINSAVTTGMSTISSTFSTSMQGVSSTMTSALSGVASTVTSQMNNIKSAFTTTLNNIKSTVTSDMNNIKSTITTGMNNIKSTITTTMSSIKSTLTSDLNSIKSTVTNTINSIKSSTSSGMSSIKSTFSSGMSSIKSTASSTCSSIVSTFNTLYSSLYSAGASAMSGLQAGLNSRRSSVMSTAQSIANSVKNTINSALKVGSPSRVMKDTGKNVGRGLVIGIKDMISNVKKASVQMADAVSDMVFGSFDAPALAFDGGDMMMSYYFDDGIMDALDDLTDAIYEDSQKPINVTVYSELDGREIAKGTAQYMQDEQDKLQARNSRRQQFSIGG